MEKKTDIIETPLKSSGNVSENSKENLSEKEQPANLKYNSDFSCSEPDTEDKNIHTAEEYTYKSRKERNGMGKRKKDVPPKKGFKIIHTIIPVACIAVILGVFLSLPLFLPKNAIASNLYSADIKLGGLTVSEAQNKLADSYKAKDINFSVVFNHEDKTEKTSFNSEQIEFTVNPEKTAEEAYNFGRSGNIFKNSWDVLRSFFTKVDIGIVPACNEETLSGIFYELGAKIYGYSQEAQCVIENNTLTITPPTEGQSHDVSEAIDEFLKSAQNGVYQDIPITLYSNEADKLDADELYEKLSTEPKNAEYQINGNDVTITDHVVGVEIDKVKLKTLVDQVNEGIGGSIPVVQTLPELTKEVLQQSLFGTTLSSYSSNYSSSSANRAYNIELAASKINGIVLADGAEFSYNAVIGNPSAANGYKMATVFSEGKVTEGVGGGVCQVSSTLYCAVLRADLKVLERRNHSLSVGYVPGGQDATVAYGVIDFRFKNNTGAPIKIIASSSSRNLTVSILGSASAKKNVEVVSQKISSIEPTMTEIKDPSLPAGKTKIISKGKPGSVYETYKRVYDKNGALLSETKTKSTYKPTAGEIAVGTAVAPSTPASAAQDPPQTTPPVSTQPAENPAENTQNTSQPPAENQQTAPENTPQNTQTTP